MDLTFDFHDHIARLHAGFIRGCSRQGRDDRNPFGLRVDLYLDANSTELLVDGLIEFGELVRDRCMRNKDRVL